MSNVSIDEIEARNPLVRDGVAQLQRQTRSLDPTSVQVYEKDLADFLVFAHDLSRRINYYNLENKKEDSWQAFFERSAAIQIARISKTRTETVRKQYDQALQALLKVWNVESATEAAVDSMTERSQQSTSRNLPNNPPGNLQEQLQALEAVLAVYCQVLDDLQTWYQSLTEGSELKGTFKAIVKTNLPYPVKTLCRLEQGLIKNRLACSYRRAQIYYRVAGVFGTLYCSVSDPKLLVDAPGDEALATELVRALPDRATAEAELDGIFQPIFNTYRQIVELAPAALKETLYADQRLPLHLSLYVAFWETLKPAHADLNRMTQRHLDFFYREVLQLKEKPAQPDRAHILLELDKFQKAFKVNAQAQASAGTDDTDVDLFFDLNEEIIVNTAQVAELKALFVKDEVVYASSVANSFDGLGAEFPKGEDPDTQIQSWLPFGDETRPTAALGLAIASDSLLLPEGDRTITFTLTVNAPPEQSLISLEDVKGRDIPALQITLSGEKAWIPASIKTLSFVDDTVSIEVNLPIEIEPVVPYHSGLANEEEPIGRLATTKPVARLTLQPVRPVGTTPAYEGLLAALQQAQLNAVTITTKVNGVRSLLLQNDLSLLEIGKPLQPFGPQPKVGSNFYIGAPAVLERALTSLKLSFELEAPIPESWFDEYRAYGVTANFNPGKIAIQSLEKRQWISTVPVVEDFFGSPSSREKPANERVHYRLDLTRHLSALHLDKVAPLSDPARPLEPWNYQTQSGFLRLQLTAPDFLHDQYPSVLARQVLAAATQEIVVGSAVDVLALEGAKTEAANAEKQESRLLELSFQARKDAERAESTATEKDNALTEAQSQRTEAQTQLAEAQSQLENLESDEINFLGLLIDNVGSTERSLASLRLEFAREQLRNAEERVNHAREDADAARTQASKVRTLEADLGKQATLAGTRRSYANVQVAKLGKPVPLRQRKAIVGAYYRLKDDSVIKADKALVAEDAVPLLAAEPYTPVVKSIQLDYEAIATQENCEFFHLHPFNGVVALPQLSPKVSLLPQFMHEGELLIGLQDLEPSTALTLLFQVIEETADTDLPRASLRWHYLIDNQWQPFEDYAVVEDTSQGLIRSGIVKLAVPADISRDRTTRLNPAFHWIKVTVDQNSGAVAHILAVHTQAVEVTFKDNNNDANRLAEPLPPESITALIEVPPEIKKVQQPYPSFDGQVKEPDDQFYTRISEHLRHKGRAVNIFDYEHLILNQFPDVYKVRCINHGQLGEYLQDGESTVPHERLQLREVAPGYVTLAVIPKLSQRATLNNLKPKVNINVLADIETYLKSVSSPWASIQVINPQYEEIRVSLRVMFKREFFANAAFYERQLEREIIGFLSPWSVDGDAEIHFGGEIYRSSILKFVEDREYVDYVIDFRLLRGDDTVNRSKVAASSPHSILVSVPFFDNPGQTELSDRPILHHQIISLNPDDIDRPPPFPDNPETKDKLGYNPLSRLTLGE